MIFCICIDFFKFLADKDSTAILKHIDDTYIKVESCKFEKIGREYILKTGIFPLKSQTSIDSKSISSYPPHLMNQLDKFTGSNNRLDEFEPELYRNQASNNPVNNNVYLMDNKEKGLKKTRSFEDIMDDDDGPLIEQYDDNSKEIKSLSLDSNSNP